VEVKVSIKNKAVRHNRILDIRKKMLQGWKMEDLMGYCVTRLGVAKVTATSYIDEAAEPYRKKYQEAKVESN
jgi:hypothetical protein